MLNPEKLLGKIVGEVVSTNGSWGKKGKKKKKGSSSLLGGLASGGGLMTLIGLGVGAYEILRQQGPQVQAGGMPPQPPPGPGSGPPPPPPPRTAASPPPPPPPAAAVAPAAPPADPVAAPPTAAAPAPPGQVGAELAVRMLQAMVAAAHADGVMDETEERAVLDRLRGADLSQEEKFFLVDELHRPKTIEELTAGITDLAVARTMYLLAAAAVSIDTEAERAWFDRLARQLGLSREMQAFLEEQAG
jgi:uncharacterized membrane protein YebE (DUF533 family)